MISRHELTHFLDTTLSLSTIRDVSNNGLQIEGTENIIRIGLAVDAGMKTYESAVEHNCQMIIVHHGLFWGGLTSITGRMRRHIFYLLEHNINLYAAHLPLDLHPELGNNIELAKKLQLENITPFGKYHGETIGYQGEFSQSITLEELQNSLSRICDNKNIQTLAFGTPDIKTVGIVSGRGGDALDEAIENKLDCFITGEPDHINYHPALENNITVLYAGHYHTEVFGVRALGKKTATEFGIETVFLNIPTDV